MSFFKKIFKSAEQRVNRSMIKRAPRVKVFPLHGISFVFNEPSTLGSQAVVNLSLEGIGFARQGMDRWPGNGTMLRGTLTINREVLPVVVQVMYVAERLVGGKFRETPLQFQESVLNHFFAEFAAAKMQEVNRNLLQEDSDGTPHFHVGENGCELFYVERDGTLVHFHMAFFGNYIEGEKNGRVRMGVIEDESKREDKPGYKGSIIVRGGLPVTKDTAGVVAKFLSNVSALDPKLRDAIAARVEKAAQ